VLNGCKSLKPLGVELLRKAGVQYVVCWEGMVGDSRAAGLTNCFYESMQDRPDDYHGAVRKAKLQLRLTKKREYKRGNPVPRERLCLLSADGDHILPGDSEDEEEWGRQRDSDDESSESDEDGASGSDGDGQGAAHISAGDGGAAAGRVESALAAGESDSEPLRCATNEQGQKELEAFKALGFKLCFQNRSIEAGMDLYKRKDEGKYPGALLDNGKQLRDYGLSLSPYPLWVEEKGGMVEKPGKKHLFIDRSALQKVFGSPEIDKISRYEDLFKAEGGALVERAEDLVERGSADKVKRAAKSLKEALKKRKAKLSRAEKEGLFSPACSTMLCILAHVLAHKDCPELSDSLRPRRLPHPRGPR